MNFIKKIVDKEGGRSVHLQFQKFSRGNFKNRAIVKVKNSSGKYTINTSAEFANEFVETLAKKLGSNKTRVTGAVVSTLDMTGKLNFNDKKQFQGVKRYLIDYEMSGEEIISNLQEFPKAFFALSFEVGEDKLKIKPKAPKSGKPGSKGGEVPKPDFCKLVTRDKEIVKSFVFETEDFKEAEIVHEFVIESIDIPEELRDSKDFARVREESKRKGKIIRIAKIDGVEKKSEINFEA